MPRVIVTCGPSFEPIDRVRRITNFSTGELGLLLANSLTRAGCDVVCFKGVGATCPLPLEGARLLPFTTNDDLRDQLHAITDPQSVAAFFHIAALCDFRVKNIASGGGAVASGAKISSRAGELTLTLEPASKVISELRPLFPQSKIVGWKYELDGTREEAIERGRRQIEENRTDACVVNGAAYGEGFGWCEGGQSLVHCMSKIDLCEVLTRWVG